MPLNDMLHDPDGYTSFHIKLIDAKGRERHAFTRVGGGAIQPQALVQSFIDSKRFSKCKEINITPIEGDVFPGDFLELVQQKPMVDKVADPKIQVGDPIMIEDFDKYGKFHVLTSDRRRRDADSTIN